MNCANNKERWSAVLILDDDDFRTGNITRRKGVLIHTGDKSSKIC